MTSDDVSAIREELARRAAAVRPRPAHYVDGKEDDFCEACAWAAADGAEVCRETNSDSDVLRWCATCGALLDYRIGPKDAADEVSHFETIAPTTAEHWAELLHAMAEVPPEDWRGERDGAVEPSPLWIRVGALLRAAPPDSLAEELAPERLAEVERLAREAAETLLKATGGAERLRWAVDRKVEAIDAALAAEDAVPAAMVRCKNCPWRTLTSTPLPRCPDCGIEFPDGCEVSIMGWRLTPEECPR